MTTWLVAHSDRFTAAISERAVNAWDSFVGTSDIGWFFADEYAGAFAHEQSPLTWADRIRTPTLIIHSERDFRCPLEQGQRLFARLRAYLGQVPPYDPGLSYAEQNTRVACELHAYAIFPLDPALGAAVAGVRP